MAEKPTTMRSTLPTRFTELRLVLLPVLWGLALLRETTALGIGLLVAGATDVVDGALARRLHAISRTGSQLDSIADLLLMSSTLAWIWMLHPEIVRERWPWLAAWLGLGAVVLLVGWVRFRRVADLHLYSAKAAGFCGYAYAVILFALGHDSRLLFGGATALALVAEVESLLIYAWSPVVDEHIGSILRRRRARRGPGV
ncbi:MAG: CDP-alcohol phosphatidyltransferase family protein [Gemmatimonadetes bacterium]|nr:CDP-alcohol phosphatidyltransferase family protein [Gemmatimonadota bacterium]